MLANVQRLLRPQLMPEQLARSETLSSVSAIPAPSMRATATMSASWPSNASPRATAFRPGGRSSPGKVCEGDIGGERVQLLMPETYMNDSGRSVQAAAQFLKIDDADIVVLHDELDLAPGKVRVKLGGGNAGHNGLRSITAHRTNDYVRVRIGIGHPGQKDLVTHWVLGDFAKADQTWLDTLLDAVCRRCAVPRQRRQRALHVRGRPTDRRKRRAGGASPVHQSPRKAGRWSPPRRRAHQQAAERAGGQPQAMAGHQGRQR